MLQPLKRVGLPLLIFLAILPAGQARPNRTLDISGPKAVERPAAKSEVFIKEITDGRVFIKRGRKGGTPNTNDDPQTLTAEVRANIIGCYGRESLVLPSGRPAMELVRQIVTEALAHNGIAVTADSSCPNVASIAISEFWLSNNSGLTKDEYDTALGLTIRVTGPVGSFEVRARGHGQQAGLMPTVGFWQKSFDAACAEFLAAFDIEWSKASR